MPISFGTCLCVCRHLPAFSVPHSLSFLFMSAHGSGSGVGIDVFCSSGHSVDTHANPSVSGMTLHPCVWRLA